MSEFLHFAEHTLQEVAIAFLVTVYIIRVIWFLRFKAGGDRQTATGSPSTTPKKGILYSWGNIAMPWAMESTRRKPLMYITFALFHIGVTASIILSFIIPYGPALLENTLLVTLFQIIIGTAFVIGVTRIIRRAGGKYMRAISSPDDYFSLILLTVWFFFAFLAVPNQTSSGEWHLLSYFILTAFFLIYVPFSKISHYLYYPFTRYYLGKTLGHRGVFPVQRG